MAKKKIAFGWYGGKYIHLNWLLPLLPYCSGYLEPFSGSASVLLNRKISPIETLNDLDGNIVNFFKILRKHKTEFIDALRLTPYAREEMSLACQKLQSKELISNFERARLFFVRTRQSISGLSQTATSKSWSYCKEAKHSSTSASINRWLKGVERLPEIIERLKNVQIENIDAFDLIRKYKDVSDILIYCDPPYLHESRKAIRAYGVFEMFEKAHIDLAEILHSCNGKVAISGYRCSLMDFLYSDFFRYDASIKSIRACGLKKKSKRQEILWTNYLIPGNQNWQNQFSKSLEGIFYNEQEKNRS